MPEPPGPLRVVYEVPLGDDVYGTRTVETLGVPPPYSDAAVVPDPNMGVSYYVRSIAWIIEDPGGAAPYVRVRLMTARQARLHRDARRAGSRDV